jgi:MYXO-CTERM domain-containing protein
MPEFSGMSLEQIEFRQADNDTIMLILANIKAPSGKPGLPPQAPVEGEARLEEVYVPTPERLRATLKDHTVPQAEKDLPYVRIVTTATNHAAADVEWTYRLDRGPWRTFRDGPELLLRDPAFYFQGWHQIDVRGRLKGHPLTLGRVVGSFKVLMDSMAPLQQARVEDGELELGGFDFVTPREDLEYSVEKAPGQFSAWTPGSRMTLEQARALAAANDGVLRVRCRDASGNVSTAEVSLRKLGETELPTADQVAAGCGCAQTPGADAGWLLALLGLALLGLRRRRAAGLLVVAAAAGLGLGLAGCSKTAGHQPDGGLPPCTLHTECSVLQCQPSTHCGVNAVPLCIQGQCECGEELKVGSAGSHSSLAVANNTVLVAAYNDCWGDLMVGRVARTDVGQNTIVYDNQWEFVDGIPWQNDPEVPTSTVRGGQRRKGEKVGRFTAVSHDAAANPVVAYYDVDRGALKYARHDGTAWKIMFVDFVGVDLDDDEPWDGDVGRYAVISMRGTERTPGIVYLAQFLPTEAPTTYRSELRYAQATTANPSTPADWEIFILDAVDVIAPTDQQGNPLEPVSWPLGDWPKGLGVTSAIERTSDGRPVIVYYDSVNGNLKAVEHDGTTFTAPIILDGEAEDGTDTGNRGLFPSLKLDPVDPTIWHVVYVDVDRKQLRYLRSSDPVVSEVIDDGLREEQNPITGLPMPVSHMVGYDAKIVVVQDDVYVAYQDATTHELRWATPRTDTCRVGGVDQRCWDLEVIKGDKPVELDPNGGYTGYEGAYGFYVNLVLDANTAFISTYVINEWDEGDPMMGRPPMNQWVEIFARQLTPG